MKSLFVAVLFSLSAFAGDKVPFTYPHEFAEMMGQPEFTVAIEAARTALPKEFDMVFASQLREHETGEMLQNSVEAVGNDTHDATVVVVIAKLRRNTLCMASSHGKIVGKKTDYKWSIKYVAPTAAVTGC